MIRANAERVLWTGSPPLDLNSVRLSKTEWPSAASEDPSERVKAVTALIPSKQRFEIGTK